MTKFRLGATMSNTPKTEQDYFQQSKELTNEQEKEGQTLYDPYKKRPIILLSNKYIREDNYILVPYYTMSGEGLLKCIKPDIIFMNITGELYYENQENYN